MVVWDQVQNIQNFDLHGLANFLRIMFYYVASPIR